VPVARLRRGLVTTALLTVVGVLFVVMVAEIALAALLGSVVAVYLRPVYCRLAGWLGRAAPAAVLTLALLIVPAVAAVVYVYLEIRHAAEYLAGHTVEVAAKAQAALDRLPIEPVDARARLEDLLGRAAEAATGLPEGAQEVFAGVSVAGAVFLFTAFYVLTNAEKIVGYLRSKVPARYGRLTERLEHAARGVLYGAIYGTIVTQTLKGLWMLTLMLLFGVPIPFTIALLAFVIGFFPVVGSWTVYLPAAGYVLVFQQAPLKAAALVAIAFVVSTPVLSLYVRPKLGADRSHVLDFYWMFVGLVAGVYTFGIPGLVLGPLLVGLLKALLDTVTDDESWREGDEHRPTVLTEEGLRHEHEPAPPTESGDEQSDDGSADGDGA
jgi:predicted PurR-regulated permease PerM